MENLYEAFVKGNVEAVKKEIEEALNGGDQPGNILNDSMIPVMEEVGRKFEEGTCYIPEMLVAARVMKEGVSFLRPHLIDSDIEPIGTYVIGTVKGDLHDIGKNLVIMMMEGVGFNVIDLGVDVVTDKFVEAVREYKPQFLGISTLLTTTMPEAKTVVEALEEAGLRQGVKVMVGGAPVSQKFSEEIGCDLFAHNAGAAATMAKSNILGE
jgi:5-methyltetrahydrofolate--homocysteine methyltransferase